MKVVTCPVCRNPTAPGDRCAACGAELAACPACGGLNTPSSANCVVCGEHLRVAPTTAFTTNQPAFRTNDYRPEPIPEVRSRSPERPVQTQTRFPPPPARPASAQPAFPSSLPPPAFGSQDAKNVTGVVRGLQVRQETHGRGNSSTTIQVLTFRLDRFDAAGSPLQPVPVQMRGRRLQGYLSEGEWVEIPGSWRSGKLLEPKRVRNLTTGSWLEVGSPPKPYGRIILIVLLLAVAVYAGSNYGEEIVDAFNSVFGAWTGQQ